MVKPTLVESKFPTVGVVAHRSIPEATTPEYTFPVDECGRLSTVSDEAMSLIEGNELGIYTY